MSRILMCLAWCLLSFYVVAQPSNNTCSNPTDISYTGSCNYVTYSNDSATASGNATSKCGNSPSTDVWYRVVIPSSGNLVINTVRLSEYMTLALYSGKCGALTEYRCDDNSGQSYRMPYIAIHDSSIAGDTLLLQMWSESGKTGKFQMCVFEPSQPSNNVCSRSINLQVSNACAYKYYTNEYAGNSGVGKPNCGNYVTNDIWFNATVPSSGRLIIRTDNNGIGDADMAVYFGDCDSLQFYRCDQNSAPGYQQAQIYVHDTSLIGKTAHIRVWKNNSLYGGGVGICAFEPQVDSNDFPQGATMLDINKTCNPSTFSNEDYSSSQAVSPPCGNYSGADIWFKTVVPSSGILVLTGDNRGMGNGAMAVYTNTVDSLVYYDCDDNSGPSYQQPQIIINDTSLANDTIHVMYWKVSSPHSKSFSICAFEPDLPQNRDCQSALPIDVTPSCNFKRFTNAYAGNSGDGLITCSYYAGGDVWFSAEVPSSGKLTAEMRSAGINDYDMSIYTGTCGALTPIQCDDRSSTYGANMPRIEINDTLLAGQKVFIQLWRRNNSNGGLFDLCVFGDLTPEVKNPSHITICQGQQIQPLSVYDGVFQYNWYTTKIGGSAVASDTFEYFTTSPGTYYVEAVNTETAQRSQRVAVSLTINPIPLLVSALDREECQDEDTLGLFVDDLGATYNWFLDSGLTVALVLDSNRFIPEKSLECYLQAIDSVTGCMANPRKLRYTLNINPLVAAQSKFSFCADSTYSISVQDQGAIYNWYSDTGLTQLLAYNSSSYWTNLSGTYYVQSTDSVTGCKSEIKSIVLEELLVPSIVGMSTYQECSYNFPVTLSVKDEAHKYQWYTDSNKVSLLENKLAQLEIQDEGVYFVQATAENGCSSQLKSISVTKNNRPSTLVPNGFEGCEYDYRGLTVDDFGDVYNWYEDSFSVSLLAQNTPLFSPRKNGVYYVKAFDKNTNCESEYLPVNLTLYNAPRPLITSDGVTLQTSTAAFYQWYLNTIAITGATDSFLRLTTKGTYEVETTTNQGCIQKSEKVIIDQLASTVERLGLNMYIYPNPVTSTLYVKNTNSYALDYNILNITGQVVESGQLGKSIDVARIPAGVYLLNIHGDSIDITFRFVKN